MNTKSLRAEARTRTAGAKPIVRRYTAVYLGVGLLMAMISLVCTALLARTGDLADLDKQAVIYTAQIVLNLAARAFLPLWSVGFTVCALGFARKQAVQPGHLLGGLYRWAGLLRLGLLLAIVFLSLTYLLIMGLMTVFVMTPGGAKLIAVMYTAVNATTITPEMEEAVLAAMEPLYLLSAPFILLLLLFLSYQFRLAVYRLLDQERPGAIRAMLESLILLRRQRWKLMKLDLSWWWYYLLTALLSGVLYAPELLAVLGVNLPLDGTVQYLICYLLYAAGLWLLYTAALARVETSYALFYDHLTKRQLTMDNGQ